MGRYHIIPGVWRGVEARPLIIYRHLIRQVGVLQDDVTRNFFKRHIRERFEEGRDDEKKRLTQHLQEARHGINLIKKANLGYPKPLIKVMEIAWGRRGKRRHELLRPILQYGKPELPHDDPRTRYPFTSKPFRALLQKAHVKNIEIKLPEKNIWDDPFPVAREPRILQRHHTKLVEQCPAPLSFEDFDRLQRLANGEETAIPPRRKVPLRNNIDPEEDVKNGERPHEMTPRSWRRLYQRILQQSLAIRQDPETGSWKVLAPEIVLKRPEADGEEVDFFLVPGPQKLTRQGKPYKVQPPEKEYW